MAATRLLIAFALSLLLFSQETKAQGNGAVRLYNNGNSPSNIRGIVEVYSTTSSRWGTICSTSSYYGLIPDVVCHQLGYTGGNSDSSDVGTDPNNGVLRAVSCSLSDYLVILQCSYQTTSSCDASDNLVQVACYSSRIWDLPYTSMVRLQSGNYAGQGTVQVYCGGWGAICDDISFNSDAVDTICTQLGYTSALSHSPVSNYNGRIIYENLYCPGVKDCLRYCASCPASDATCSANEAVNVTCTHDGTDYGGSYRYTCGIDGLSAGVIAGIVIGVLLLFIICLAVTIGIPVCICCCLGIGIGAAAGSTRRTNVYSTI